LQAVEPRSGEHPFDSSIADRSQANANTRRDLAPPKGIAEICRRDTIVSLFHAEAIIQLFWIIKLQSISNSFFLDRT
jgi:hypothetical protein